LPDLLIQREVGTANRVATVEQQMSQAAHPAAAGADQMNKTAWPCGLQQVARFN